ncbi:MAG: DUF4160 domain-containing protein [Bacteroidales bacterium]|nr:DUF4160 domain-containing protein [Bacteroidales bacterium]
MPELFRLFGFTYYFFSREHLPIHVHIEGKDGYAIYDLEGNRFLQRYAKGIKAGDLHRIEAVLEENKESIVNTWKSYFNNKRYGDQGNMV